MAAAVAVAGLSNMDDRKNLTGVRMKERIEVASGRLLDRTWERPFIGVLIAERSLNSGKLPATVEPLLIEERPVARLGGDGALKRRLVSGLAAMTAADVAVLLMISEIKSRIGLFC